MHLANWAKFPCGSLCPDWLFVITQEGLLSGQDQGAGALASGEEKPAGLTLPSELQGSWGTILPCPAVFWS